MDNRMWLVYKPTGVGVFLANDNDGAWYSTVADARTGSMLQEFLEYVNNKDQRYNLILVQELTHKWDALGVIEGTNLRKFVNLRENEHRHMLVPPAPKANLIPVTIHFNSDGSLFHHLMASVPSQGDTIVLPPNQISSALVEMVVTKVQHCVVGGNGINVFCSPVKVD